MTFYEGPKMKDEHRKKNEYKSAVRSRQKICDACISLMLEKPSNKITVTDIVRRAGINRGTFYAHYTMPEEVFEQLTNEFIGKLFVFVGEFEFSTFVQNPMELLSKISGFLETNLEMYRNLVMIKESESFVVQFKAMLIDYIVADKSIPAAVKDDATFLSAVCFFAGGLVSIYYDWIRNILPESIHNAEQTISDIIMRAAYTIPNYTILTQSETENAQQLPAAQERQLKS